MNAGAISICFGVALAPRLSLKHLDEALPIGTQFFFDLPQNGH